MEQETLMVNPVLKTRKFTWRTIVIPLLFIGLHFILSFLFTAIDTVFVTFNKIATDGPSSAENYPAFMADVLKIVISHTPIILALMSICIIPICLVFLKLNAKRDARILLAEKMRLVDLLPALAMIVGMLGVTNLWFILLENLRASIPVIDTMLRDYQNSSNALSPTLGIVWMIIGVAILTPIAEELIFRGIIQGELRKAMPEGAAIVVQALLFGIYHMQLFQSVYATLAGLVLGLAYYWSRSLWVPIAMHILFNFIGGTLPYMLDDRSNGILVIAEIAFILVAVIAGLFLKANRRKLTIVNVHEDYKENGV